MIFWIAEKVRPLFIGFPSHIQEGVMLKSRKEMLEFNFWTLC